MNAGQTQSGEKTVIKALALGGLDMGGAPCAVDVKNGKIIRVRPLHYDWKYDHKEFNPWKFERNGKTFEAGHEILARPLFPGL